MDAVWPNMFCCYMCKIFAVDMQLITAFIIYIPRTFFASKRKTKTYNFIVQKEKLTRPDIDQTRQTLSLPMALTGKLVPNRLGQLLVGHDCCDCTPPRVITPNSAMRATHDGSYRP